MTTNNLKSTKDLYLAAAWLALGARYEKTDKTDKRHMEFQFSPKPMGETGTLATIPLTDLEKIELEWANGCVMVNAVSYKDALQRLKAIIHSE